ncbi:MAG: hypothetical protein ACOCRX_05655 [Candidatus Woesearchaeota archaeon]
MTFAYKARRKYELKKLADDIDELIKMVLDSALTYDEKQFFLDRIKINLDKKLQNIDFTEMDIV